jgi:hypothetical protein
MGCYYKKACGNENTCGNEVLISRKMDWISVSYPTGIDKHCYTAYCVLLNFEIVHYYYFRRKKDEI